MEKNQSPMRFNSFFNQEMNLFVTANAKATQIFNSVVFFVGVYVMNMKLFVDNLTKKTFFRKVSVPNRDVAPFFISRSITKMVFSLQGELTFSRAKTAEIFTERPRFIWFRTNHTNFFFSRLSSAAHRAVFRRMNSIVSRVEFFATSFANYFDFRSESHGAIICQ